MALHGRAGGLSAFLKELRLAREEVIDLEPSVDERSLEGLGLQDAAVVKEQEDLEAGAVLKGVVEPGEGEASPGDGDLVFLHFTLRNSEEEVVLSTLAEHGGSGRPAPFQLGKGGRMLRGLELAVKDMRRGERALVSIKPPYAYKHPDCKEAPPPGLRADEPVSAEVVLTNWYPSRGVRAVGEGGNVFRRLLQPSSSGGWETPRPPFEATFHLTLRVPTTTGRQEEGRVYYTTTPGRIGGTGGDAAGSDASSSSSSGGQPLTASLGAGALPPAVEAALGSMVRGDAAVVACPAATLRGGTLLPDPPADVLAAGAGQGQQQGGQQGQSAGDWLEFSVQLLDFLQVRDMTGDGQVVKRIVHKGRGEFPVDCPLEDSSVKVHYRVRQAAAAGAPAGDWLFDTRQQLAPPAAGSSSRTAAGQPLEFDTGMGAAPDALDMAVRLMLRGETSLVTASPKYAYAGREAAAPPGLDPGSPVDFELELVDFEGEPNRADMSCGDKLARAQRWKEQGNSLFKQAKYRLARVKYQKALKWANQATAPETDEEAELAVATRLAALTNLAACAQRETEYGEAISWCTKAVELDPEHAKAYFRRAAALAALGEWEAARGDLALVAELDPEARVDCEREERRISALERKAEEKSRRDLRSFLDR